MRSLRSWTLASIAAFSLPLSSHLAYAQATPSSEEQALSQRVEELERKLKQLEERLEQQAQPAAPPASAKSTETSEAAKPAEPSPQEQAMQKQIDELGQQVKTLEQKEQSAQASPAAKTVLPIAPGVRPGLVLTSPSSPFQLRFGAVVQVDYREFFNQPSPPPQSGVDTFVLRRIRPIFEGGYDDFGFKIMPDFGNGSNTTPTTSPTPQIFDAWIYWTPSTEFNARVGKMKAPLGLEELQEDVNLAFPERAFPSQLIPNREIGLQASGSLFKRTLSYAAGVFNGAVDNNSANDGSGDFNNGKDVDVRVFAQPWKNTDLKAVRGLGIGVGYGFGIESGSLTTPALPTYVTPGQQTWFTYNTGAFANGARTSWTPQLYYSVGPFGLLGEWTNTAQVFTRSTNTQTVSNRAWQVQLAWVLSGEDASYLGVTPSQSFSLKQHHWGGLELVARVSQLKVDSNTFVGTAATQLANPNTQPNKATDYGIGLSWDLSREVRIMFTYDQTKFDGGAANGASRPDEKVLITRFQYAL